MTPFRSVRFEPDRLVVRCAGVASPAGFVVAVVPCALFWFVNLLAGAPALFVVGSGFLVLCVGLLWWRPLLVVTADELVVRNFFTSTRFDANVPGVCVSLPASDVVEVGFGTSVADVRVLGGAPVRVFAVGYVGVTRTFHRRVLEGLPEQIEAVSPNVEVRVGSERGRD